MFQMPIRRYAYTEIGFSQYGYKREEVDFSCLDEEFFKAMFGQIKIKKDEVKQYGKYKYRVIDYDMTRNYGGTTVTFYNESIVTMVNGYVLLFQYASVGDFDKYHNELEYILQSVRVD